VSRLAALLAVAAVVISTAASAAGDPAATASARKSAANAPAAAASAGSAGITLAAAQVNGSVGAIVSDAKWRLTGVVSAYVPGQRVTLHVFRNGARIISRSVPVRRRGSRGVFSSSLQIGGVGRLTVRAIEAASPVQGRVVSRAFSLWLVAPQAQPGASSFAVRILQYQLSALHYVVGAPGVYDARTQRAVLAFRKVAGLPLDTQADASVFAALAAGEGVFVVRFPTQGRHIEGDLTHQVLALIGSDGVAQQIYPMSSGKPSTPTVLGSFAVYNKTPGVNSEGMVDSSYFYTGYAIHGYYEVPTYAASHGCLRVPIPDAPTIYAWATVGTRVDVYYR
jgi:peptidoglycan hydrolase-like protein with peptidoglycan-binding domain